MANEEHLEILMQGVKAWNNWRKENPGTKPDLSGAVLKMGHLAGAKLNGANLEGADLWGSDLSRARLWRAKLRSANLG